MRRITFIIAAGALAAPTVASAWGYEGHEIVADVAKGYLTPGALAKVNAILATDTSNLPRHDMASEATWADAWRGASHRETA